MMPILSKRIITELQGSSPYLVRWTLALPFGFSIKLHQILRADDDRCAHDHPWPFLRIILAGGYIEQHGEQATVSHRKPWRPWAPWRLYYCPSNFRHRIIDLPGGSSWTLVICGPRIRRWGFFTTSGWVHWKEFVSQAHAKRVLWCDDGRSINDERGAAR